MEQKSQATAEREVKIRAIVETWKARAAEAGRLGNRMEESQYLAAARRWDIMLKDERK